MGSPGSPGHGVPAPRRPGRGLSPRPSAPVALGIDTATRRGSVALARDGRVLVSAALTERGAHARELMGRIEAALREAGTGTEDLGAIAVTLGPGSFTGVRVGLATAKGIAYALDIPLDGLSTLEATARARAAAGDMAAGTVVWAALEAGRGEVYAASFEVTAHGVARRSDDRSWRPSDLLAALSPGARLAGDAADAIAALARAAGASFEARPALLLAPVLAEWGCARAAAGEGYAPGGPRPNYIRPSDAEARRR